MEDLVATGGGLIAMIAIIISYNTNFHAAEGIASIIIGLMMLFVVGKVFLYNAAGAIGEADELMEQYIGDKVMLDTDIKRLTRRPNPFGNRSVGAFLLKAEPINTKNWFAASPKLCKVSANKATFPVKKYAVPLIIEIIKFTIAAIMALVFPFFSNKNNCLISQLPLFHNHFKYIYCLNDFQTLS